MNFDKVNERLENVRRHGWQRLDLRNCGLELIPKEIFRFKNLVSIDLSNDPFCDEENRNKIKSIPDEIANLNNLKRFNISNNELKLVSEKIANLPKLNYLNLNNNKLTDISEKIANMESLEDLLLEDNPFDLIPPEIVARGIHAIRNFFAELEEKDYLYEVKLLLVGQGRVGKTCLSKSLIDKNYILEDNASTEGINIQRWIVPKEEISLINSDIQRDFKINIWDFGGQEIYHSTHQFFLTKRSIYLLVTESRKEDSHDDFYYWLNIIQLLGDNSPVVLVLNKCDQPTKELPFKEYKESFNNLVAFHKISLKTGFEEQLSSFKNDILTFATSLPHIGNPLPKVWVDIRLELDELKVAGKNYISREEYLEICKKHYRKEQSALHLSDYFHDLGVILHFQDDIYLKNTVFLNHEWLTSAVYKILDDPIVIDKKGRFNYEDISRIWNNSELKNKTSELISLMKNRKFDLCFELPNGEYLVPRLLPVDEIEHEWKTDMENTKFELRYKFMPKGILTRLIVKLNLDILNNYYWRYGVILESEGTRAFIREKYFENKITIELNGNNKREYLFYLRKVISEIHKSYNKIKFSEMIPCNCSYCKVTSNPEFFPFELLQRYEMNNITEIRCNNSLEMVKVSNLTSDIIRKNLSTDKIVACENKNAELLKLLEIPNVFFYPENDSSGVFISVRTKVDRFGIRDRDYLIDSEIEKIRRKYAKLIILDYYCFENYMYHPQNIQELVANQRIEGFNIDTYINEIITQKNANKDEIVSIYKSARKNYQEFKVESENLEDKGKVNEIIEYLKSDDLEVFFKSFSMKSFFDKKTIAKYNFKKEELVKTEWFRNKIDLLLRPISGFNS